MKESLGVKMDNIEMARLSMIFLLVIFPMFLALLLCSGIAFMAIKDFIKNLKRRK